MLASAVTWHLVAGLPEPVFAQQALGTDVVTKLSCQIDDPRMLRRYWLVALFFADPSRD
jgi:hypothetical protein